MFTARLFRSIFFLSVLWGFFSQNTTAAGYEPSCSGLSSGDTTQMVVRNIEISGNKLTRNSIILREITFGEGETIPREELARRIHNSRENIFNTRLFNIVKMDMVPVTGSDSVDIGVSVIERWYIWPIPFVQLSDRNFNAWWESRDFSRITYGVDLSFRNVRGRNETLQILTHFGYNQKYGFTYTIPYIDRKEKLGLGFGAEIDLNHEIAVKTEDNKPVYMKDNSRFLKKLATGYIQLIARPDIYSTHSVKISYNYYDFAEALQTVPSFFVGESTLLQFFTFNYFFKNDHRDVQFYPLTGYYIDAEINYSIPFAVACNAFLKANFRKYWQLGNRWYCASGFTGKISLEEEQPYPFRQGLGYGREFVRGYEYYVVDGQHFALLKNTLKWAILPQRVVKLPFLKSEKFNTVPLALYLNAFIDLGYVYNNEGDNDYLVEQSGNTLQNSLLTGYGAGIDFTTYYDIVVRVEFSLNTMGDKSFYLHFMAPI